jgi:hypothetical protein
VIGIRKRENFKRSENNHDSNGRNKLRIKGSRKICQSGDDYKEHSFGNNHNFPIEKLLSVSSNEKSEVPLEIWFV